MTASDRPLVVNHHQVPERCITCSDEAVEAVVVVVEGSTATVRVEGGDERIDGAEERVAIELVPDAVPGDVLLCHAGIALEVVPR